MNSRWSEAWWFCALLWSSCLVSMRLLDRLGSRLLVPVLRHQSVVQYVERPPQAQRSAGRGRPALRAAESMRVSWWWRTPLAACVAKDVVLFLRDPAQWSQGLVFFGLLGAYFANIHRITWLGLEPSWKVGVSSLNLACTLLVFGSLAVRFLFPQMSLEGKRLWLTRTVPGGIRRVFFAKLAFYGALAVLLVEGLLALSAKQLHLPPLLVWWFAGVGLLAGLSLVGLTLGLGARLIDPSASDPARIVSSSSGALVLVLMLVYVGGVSWSLVTAWTSWTAQDLAGFVVAGAALLIFSWVFGMLPARQGLRALERLEF